MKIFFMLILATQLAACASSSVAKKLNFVAFDDKIKTDDLKSVGSIEGKDCTWYVWGYAVGEDPTVRKAFLNAAQQREDGFVPGMKATSKGSGLKVVKNVSVENSGFNAYLASRSCVVVTGAGFQ